MSISRRSPKRSIHDLRSSLAGSSLTELDSGYEAARQIYNRYHDLRPSLIVYPSGADDVRRVLDYCAIHELELAIRGGGHHIAGYGSTAGGIVLDFGRRRDIVIDPSRGMVEAAAGARLGDLDRATVRQGLVVPSGTVSHTGLAGLTLGGGVGWLIGLGGLTCDRLIGADVMLAGGTCVRAEDPEHSSLLWALKGGGGQFGVVLRFRYAALPLPSVIGVRRTVEWPLAFKSLCSAIRALGDYCPRGLTVAPVVQSSGTGPSLVYEICYAGDDRDGDFEYIFSAIGPSTDASERMTDYIQWQTASDHLYSSPMRGYWSSRYFDLLSDGALASLLAKAEATSRSGYSILIEHLHGAFHDTASTQSAFPNRAARFGVLCANRWLDKTQDEEMIAHVKETILSIAHESTGVPYSNYNMIEEDCRGERPSDTFVRTIGAVKKKYDPGNLFRRHPSFGGACVEK